MLLSIPKGTRRNVYKRATDSTAMKVRNSYMHSERWDGETCLVNRNST